MPPAPVDAAPQDRDIIELLQGGASDQAFERLVDRY
jgi:hypothetical protein